MCNREISSRHIECFFFAKLYDHQGPIAMGVVPQPHPPPLTVRVMRNTVTGRGLNQMYRETGVGGYSFEFVVVALTHKVGVDSGVGVGVTWKPIDSAVLLHSVISKGNVIAQFHFLKLGSV